VNIFGVFVLLLASLSWAIGSVYGRGAVLPSSPLLATGMEMIAGGVGLLILSIVFGEWNQFSPGQVSNRSWISLVYLIVFGALLGFAAYTWLLRVAPITLVSTYAYVNPLVAILLGRLFAFEPITSQLVSSAVLIIGSVVFITLTSRGAGRFRNRASAKS
jgi:drug/metabolite transporter (DMT)-like permease